MSGCGIQHINKGAENPSNTIDLKITGVAAGLKYQVNEMALSTKKKMVSRNLPSPYLVFTNFRWLVFLTADEPSGSAPCDQCFICFASLNHLNKTAESFDAFRGRGARVPTHSEAPIASGSSVLNKGLISRRIALPRSRHPQLAAARQP